MSDKPFRFLEADAKKRPPNYASKKTQRKLLMLIGSLFVVIYAMQQVSRPEAWQWLVQLDKNAKTHKTEKDLAATNRQILTPSPSSELTRSASESASQKSGGDGPVDTIGAVKEKRADSGNSASSQNETEHLEREYWHQALLRLESSEAFEVVNLISGWTNDTAYESTTNEAQASGVQRLVQLRERFTNQVKQRAAISAPLSNASDQNSEQSSADDVDLPDRQFADLTSGMIFDLPDQISLQQAQAVEDQSRWLLADWQRVAGVQSAGETAGDDSDPLLPERTLGEVLNRQPIWRRILVQFFDPNLKTAIQDGARLGRPTERAAWLRWVQRAAIETEISPAMVTRQNLMGQSEQFRGKWVTIRGTLRRLETKKQTSAAISRFVQDDQYVVAWIQPGVSSQGPYCVYVTGDAELLKLAEESSEQRRGIEVSGLYFKIFPYPVSETQTAVAPLLIARKTSVQSLGTPKVVTPPSSTLWGLIIGGVVSLAAVLGILGWFSTRYRTANPIGDRLYKSGRLGWLDEESVETVGQSLQRMADEDAKGPPTRSDDSSPSAIGDSNEAGEQR